MNSVKSQRDRVKTKCPRRMCQKIKGEQRVKMETFEYREAAKQYAEIIHLDGPNGKAILAAAKTTYLVEIEKGQTERQAFKAGLKIIQELLVALIKK